MTDNIVGFYGEKRGSGIIVLGGEKEGRNKHGNILYFFGKNKKQNG
jgi:hypothetical protein